MLWRLIGVLGKNRSLLLNLAIAAFFSIIVSYTSALITQFMVDRVVPSNNFGLLYVFAVGLVIYEVLVILINTYRKYLRNIISRCLDGFLLKKYIEIIIQSEYGAIKKYSRGDLLQRIYDSQTVKNYLFENIIQFYIKSLVCGTGLIVIFMLSVHAGLIVVVGAMLFAIIYAATNKIISRMEKKRFEVKSQMLTDSNFLIDDPELVKHLNMQDRYQGKMNSSIDSYLDVEARVRTNSILINCGMESVRVITIVSVKILVIAMIFSSQKFTIGQMLTIFTFSTKIFSMLLGILNVALELKRMNVVVERFFGFTDCVPLQTNNHEGKIFCEKIDNLDLTSVVPNSVKVQSPARANDKWILTPGSKLKISGKNGSGKTHLCREIMGLSNDLSATPKVNNINLKNVYGYQDRIMMSGADDKLIEDTLWFNLSLGKDISSSMLIEYARKIHILDLFDSLDSGFLTEVGNKSKRVFSEGEKQKILFLRMCLSDADVLIFDEIFRGVDKDSIPAMETIIMELDNKIVIYVTHHSEVNLVPSMTIELSSNTSPEKMVSACS